ncbi:WxL domain-containing protein [Vagococcus carniphilus]|uniref:WxL domain-containing protein n=1 Tax=Vagococcus carniphilus TaxID=218144 RepID=UPI003B5CFD74
MKFTTKSASVLLAILAASTIGGTAVFADEAEDAKVMDGTGKVTVTDATDTEDDKDKDKTEDPEEDGDKDTPETVDPNLNKGPIKVERVSQLIFGEISNASKTITRHAAPVDFKDGSKRGNLIQFSDVRSEVYGYTIQAAMTQQFKLTGKEDKLGGSEIAYSNGILKKGTGNENTAPSVTAAAFTLKEDGAPVTVITADKAKEEGKGRYTLEFGQSDEYDATKPGAPQGGIAGTDKNSVKLTVPTKTAANMKKGAYEAKITWTVVTAP